MENKVFVSDNDTTNWIQYRIYNRSKNLMYYFCNSEYDTEVSGIGNIHPGLIFVLEYEEEIYGTT